MDAAGQPRPRRRARHRLRRDGGRRRRALHPGRGAARAPTSASWRQATSSRHAQGQRARRPPLHAAVPVLRRHAERVPGARRRLRLDRGRHRRRAHGARLRRGRPDRLQRGRASRRSARWTSTGDSQPRSRRGPASTCSTPTRTSSASSRTVASSCATTAYDHSYPHCWRCDQPLVYRAISSWFVQVTDVPRPDGRAQPADPLGARARQGRQFRQVARQRPRLVDQPQPVLGLADPGVEERRPGLPAHRRLRIARRARARLRRAGQRPAPARRSTISMRPNPDDPTGRRRCGASPRCSTAGSSRGRCRSPRCTTRSRTPTGSSTTIPATSSSSTWPRRAAGSTRCTCSPRRCSTGRRSGHASATASCSATTARRCRRASATTPIRWRCSTPTAPTRCVGTCCRRRSCAAATSPSPRPASARRVRHVVLPIWNT